MTKLNTAEEYLDDQDSNGESIYEDYFQFRYNCVDQIIRYIKSVDIVPTYGMVFDIEVWLEDNLSVLLESYGMDTILEIIEGNIDVEV